MNKLPWTFSDDVFRVELPIPPVELIIISGLLSTFIGFGNTFLSGIRHTMSSFKLKSAYFGCSEFLWER